MYFHNLKYSLGCSTDEDQRHIFEKCGLLKSDQNMKMYDAILQESDKKKLLQLSSQLTSGDKRYSKVQTSIQEWEPMAVPWGGLLLSTLTPTSLINPPPPGVGTHDCAMGRLAPQQPHSHPSSSSGLGAKGQKQGRGRPIHTWRTSSQDLSIALILALLQWSIKKHTKNS